MTKVKCYDLIKTDDNKLDVISERTLVCECDKTINSPNALADALRELFLYNREVEEKAYIVAISINGKIVGASEVSHGTQSSTQINERGIAKRLLLIPECDSFVFVHNHPSGNSKPSGADNESTQKLKKLGNILSINLLDSIIIGSDNYFSYKANGCL